MNKATQANTSPCPLCGYSAPGQTCPHCSLRSTDPSLLNPPSDPLTAMLDGFRAVPTGLYLLMTTRGVKRLLVPPVILTLAAFAWIFYLLWSFLWSLVDAAKLSDPSLLKIETEWVRDAAEWLITHGIVIWSAKISGVFLVGFAGFLLSMWIGSIVYEAIAGPFLDEIHGRFEKKWFGVNPRDEIERPTALPTSRCALLSVLAGVPAFSLIVLWWLTSGIVAWFFLLLSPVPFIALGMLIPDYGVWLGWVARVEGRTLWVSVKASLLAGLLLVPALLIKLVVPVVGVILFAIFAGFATALTLLDIPFSRRQGPLGKRMQFLLRNFPALVSFGFVSGLLYTVPLFGPLLMVPAASIGGLWLVCRLDKNSLRDPRNKISRQV